MQIMQIEWSVGKRDFVPSFLSSDFDGGNDDAGQQQEQIALGDAEQPADMPPVGLLPAIMEFSKIAPCQLPFGWSQI